MLLSFSSSAVHARSPLPRRAPFSATTHSLTHSFSPLLLLGDEGGRERTDRRRPRWTDGRRRRRRRRRRPAVDLSSSSVRDDTSRHGMTRCHPLRASRGAALMAGGRRARVVGLVVLFVPQREIGSARPRLSVRLGRRCAHIHLSPQREIGSAASSAVGRVDRRWGRVVVCRAPQCRTVVVGGCGRSPTREVIVEMSSSPGTMEEEASHQRQ